MTTTSTDQRRPDLGGPDVWIAQARVGIEYHRTTTGDATTPCGRSTLTGMTLARGQAVTRYASLPCPRCYADPVGEANRDALLPGRP